MVMDIIFEKVNFAYQSFGEQPKKSLKDISVTIHSGKITALIGKTGSGKTTFTQLCNGLLLADDGIVHIGSRRLTQTTTQDELFAIKQSVGIVFQFPETQLFARTVIDDVMFGPLNFGCSPDVARQQAISALGRVGIDELYFNRSPLSLSGGQMRRVAIAGILAYQPQVMLFDEPTAGLDEDSKKVFFHLCQSLRQDGVSVVLVSHDMNEIAELADDIIVLKDGCLALSGTAQSVFYSSMFKQSGLDKPDVVKVWQTLEITYGIDCQNKPVTFSDLVAQLENIKAGAVYE